MKVFLLPILFLSVSTSACSDGASNTSDAGAAYDAAAAYDAGAVYDAGAADDAGAAGDAGAADDAGVAADAQTDGSVVDGGTTTPLASYGPNGTHWPSNTPAPDATFVYDVEVVPTWSAIQAAIDGAPASGNARIRVQPGTLPVGFGSGSTDVSVLTDGAPSRSSKILIVPRDGFGSVAASADSTLANMNSRGYSFAVGGVAFMGFDFVNQGVVIRSAQEFAIGWARFGVLNITANAGDSLNNELVECVLPNQEDTESDRSAFRCANNNDIIGAKIIGSYFAPAYKASGSSAHCDTLQFSSTGGGLDDIVFQDSIFFQSSSQTLMMANLDTVTFDHTAIIGGLRATGRFPIESGRHVMTAENALWGGAEDAYADELVVMGSINSSISWTSVIDSVQGSDTGSTPTSGAFTIDSRYAGQSTLQTTWIDANAPEPTLDYLQRVWSAL